MTVRRSCTKKGLLTAKYNIRRIKVVIELKVCFSLFVYLLIVIDIAAKNLKMMTKIIEKVE